MKTHSTILAALVVAAPTAIIAQSPENPEAEEAALEQEVAAEAAADSLATYDTLEDLVIEAVRPLIKSDGATTTYSVDEDQSAKGQTLLDVLRRVPGVTVDGQDNIQIQGKSDFKIMVNGREEPMLSQNASEIFKSMPASAIAKIEVITDPGAKFDAEGTAGILNLVTERVQKENGYSGSVNAGAGVSDYNAGGFVTGRIDKVTAQVNLNYAGNDGLERTQKTTMTTDYLQTGDRLDYLLKQRMVFNYLQGGYKLSWEPNARNLFTTSFNFTLMNAAIKDAFQSNSFFRADGTRAWFYDENLDARIHRNSYSADASYQHNFDDAGHLLVASYAFTFGDNLMTYDREHLSQEGISDLWRRKAYNTTLSRQHTAQLDYTNPFRSEHHKLEAGLKGIFRRNSAYGWEKNAALPDSPLTIDPDMETDLAQFQDILAAYASYTFTAEQWSARAGVRYEHTRMGIESRDGKSEDFTSRLNDVVPNASLTYSFGPARNLRFAYSMRISRPTIDQVNPFEQGIGFHVKAGNPDLTSERLNKISLTYTSFGRSVGGSFGVDYSHTANAIESVERLEGLKVFETYMNTGDSQTVGFRGFLNWTIIRNMTLAFNGDVEYVNMKAPSLGYYASGWKANLSANWSWRLDNIANFGAFGGWGSPTPTLQGRYYSWRYYGVSVGRDFLKDKSLNISVNAMNFFTPFQTFKSLSKTPDVKGTSRTANNNFRAGVSISWRFGSMREQVKTTAADLGTDDLSTKSGNGGGGQGSVGL